MTAAQESHATVDLFEFEDASGWIALFARLASTVIGALVGIAGHPDYLALGRPPIFLTAPRTTTIPLRAPGTPP